MKKLIIVIILSCILLNGYNQNTTIANNPSPATNQPVNIGFARGINAPDLQIKQVTAALDKDWVVFTLTYRSQKDRYLSFFTPPDGDILMHLDRDGIKIKDTIATFYIARTDFQFVDNITMRFSKNEHGESDRNFIFLDLAEPSVIKLLGLTNRHNFLSGILSLRSSLISMMAMWLLVPLLLFVGTKANSYTSVVERWIKNKWLMFNVKVFIFSIAIMVIILFGLFISGHFKKPLPATIYLYLLIIPMVPSNLVYIIENAFFKSKALFWLRQYLNLVFISIGLYIT